MHHECVGHDIPAVPVPSGGDGQSCGVPDCLVWTAIASLAPAGVRLCAGSYCQERPSTACCLCTPSPGLNSPLTCWPRESAEPSPLQSSDCISPLTPQRHATWSAAQQQVLLLLLLLLCCRLRCPGPCLRRYRPCRLGLQRPAQRLHSAQLPRAGCSSPRRPGRTARPPASPDALRALVPAAAGQA